MERAGLRTSSADQSAAAHDAVRRLNERKGDPLMKSLKLLAVFAVVAVLGACSGPWDIETLRGTTRTTAGTPFTQALTQEYRSLTLFDADQDKDWPNAYIFAAKGLASARGENVLPENPANWRLAPPARAELD